MVNDRRTGDRGTSPIDRAGLRAGRLARLQDAMQAQGVEACLLFNEPNIRYATGADRKSVV